MRAQRRVLLVLIVVVCVPSWRLASALICQNCYRLGNYIDFYLQRELLRSRGGGSGSSAAAVASQGPEALAYGIWRGVRMRRLLHPSSWFEPNSLIEQLHHRQEGVQLPPGAWARSDMRQLAYALHEGGSAAARSGTPDFFLWWNHTHLRALLPHIRETIRAELASLPSTAAAQRVGAHASTEVVVHFRAGDFTRETRWKPSQLRLCVASMVAAVQTFPDAQLITSFHILGGGIDHGCDPTVDDCGASALALVARGLRVAFPNATTRLSRGGSVDEDFIRMVYAPKLLLGSYGTELKVGSSFAVYAAAASTGHVRSPGCFLRFDTCMPITAGSGVMAMTPDVRWQGYSHPSCKRCRNLHADASWPHIAALRDRLVAV